jgi:hypothetical protein
MVKPMHPETNHLFRVLMAVRAAPNELTDPARGTQ